MFLRCEHKSHCRLVSCEQTQVGGKKTSVILQKLEPDTPYSISVAAVYATGISKDISEEGKTSKTHIQRQSFTLNICYSEICVLHEYKLLSVVQNFLLNKKEKIAFSWLRIGLLGLRSQADESVLPYLAGKCTDSCYLWPLAKQKCMCHSKRNHI